MLGRQRTYSASDLKLIAMGTMVLDHLAFHLMERGGMDLPMAWYILGTAMRLAGRVAFPLYGFFLVQGFFHTGDWEKYMKRMVLLALVSEIPFNLLYSGKPVYPEGQNTLVTLSISLLALKGIRAVQTWEPEEGAFGGRAGAVWFKTAAIVLIAAASMAAAGLFRSDYGPLGVFFILILYFYNGDLRSQGLAGAAVLALHGGIVWGAFGCIAFFFISRYNGTRGRRLGYLPYVFYPAHLLIIYFIGVLIYGIHF